MKTLREQNGFTQAGLARRLGVSRASVNSWEMGLALPSTAMIVEIAHLFRVSTDFLLGMGEYAALDISGLTSEEAALLAALVEKLRAKPTIEADRD